MSSDARPRLIVILACAGLIVLLSLGTFTPLGDRAREVSLDLRSDHALPRSGPEFSTHRDSPSPSIEASPVSVPLGGAPVGLTFDAANKDVYVALGNGTISVINSTTDSATASVNGYPWPVPGSETYDAAVAYVYVAGGTSGSCGLICTYWWIEAINGSTNRVAAVENFSVAIPNGLGEFDCLTVASTNGTIFACDPAHNQVDLFNGATDTPFGTIPVGTWPTAGVEDSANGDVYVTNWGSDNVSVIRAATAKVVGSISVGSGPVAIAFDTSSGYLYVANNISDNLTIIDSATNQVVGSLGIGWEPDAVAYDPANQGIFVADSNANELTEISGANDRPIGEIPVGSDPVGIAYDARNAGLYVANLGSDNLTVLFLKSYAVTFVPTGLPAGTEWWINVSGEPSANSTESPISLELTNGSYSYTMATNDKEYAPASASGSFSVNGASVSESLTFSPVTYTVTFKETGLPYLANWYVNGTGFSSATTVGTLAGTANSISLQNGSYTYTVATTAAGYSVNRTTGTFIVNGAPVQIPSFAFTPASRQATFLGLPATEGYVLFGGIVAVVLIAGIFVIVLLHRRKAPPSLAPASSTPGAENPPPPR